MTADTTQPAGALEQARQEGVAYYNAHPSKGYDNPYAFAQFPGITQEEFDRDKRPLLDAFHEGWAEARRQDHGR